ncbi:MAG: transposase [Pseudomonadota bacterium]
MHTGCGSKVVGPGKQSALLGGARETRERMQNAFVESLNGRLRDEFLNETLSRSLLHARRLIAEWQTDYNEERPHASLGGLTPNESAARSNMDQNPNILWL